jgi:hypothetical protein
MNCSDFQSQLEQAIEMHGPASSEKTVLARHFESCHQQHCRRLWEQTELLARALRDWQVETTDINLTHRVIEQLHVLEAAERVRDAAPRLEPRYALVHVPPSATSAGASPPGNGVWVSLATLAAALLLVLSILTLSGPATRQQVATSTEPPTNNLVAGDPSPPADQPAASVAGTPGGRTRSYSSMPLSATQFLTDAVVLVVPADLSDPDEEPTPADVWADRLGKRWEPIGRELSSALEALLDAVPGSESAS